MASKGLEALGKIVGTQSLTMYEQNECLKTIENELKALEIIRKCPFDLLEWAKTHDEINDTCYYELLKEVLK